MPRRILFALVAAGLLAAPIAAGQTPSKTVDPDIASGKEQRALSAARSQWKARGVASYTYLISIHCFCPPTTDIKVVVRRGKVRIDRNGSASFRRAAVLDNATVPRLFRTIQRAIDARAARLTVRYGPRGVPRQIYVDRDSRVADDEVGYLVRRFSPLRG